MSIQEKYIYALIDALIDSNSPKLDNILIDKLNNTIDTETFVGIHKREGMPEHLVFARPRGPMTLSIIERRAAIICEYNSEFIINVLNNYFIMDTSHLKYEGRSLIDVFPRCKDKIDILKMNEALE